MTEWNAGRSGTGRGSWGRSFVLLFSVRLIFRRRPGGDRAQQVPDTLRVDVGLEPRESPRTWRDYR